MLQRLLFYFALLGSLSGQAQLIINEVLYDPSNTALDGDANGDGVYDQEEDSFIEFINTGSFNYDAGGLQIWDDTTSGSLKYTVPTGTLVPPNGALVVFGGGTPTGNFGGAIVLTASSSPDGLNLNNSGEVIIIFNSQGEPVLSFDSDALSNNPNESYTRNPDITGAFEQHNDNTPLLFSPGTQIDGTPFNTTFNPPLPTCNPAFNPSAVITGNYTVKFSWSNLSYGSYSLNVREVGATTWSSFVVSGLQRTLENRAPGNYEFYVADLSGNDYSCTGTFQVNCATDISYSYNGFQAPELGRLGRLRVFNTTGGKRKYDIYLVGSQGDTTEGLDRRQVNFTDLGADSYTIYVRDAYGCLADSVGSYTVNALDTSWIPNLINAPNNSPNGFRPTWNSVDGIINYQLRIQNVTDGTLEGFITGINDTSYAVTNLPTGKLYRFNVRSRYNNGVANVVSGYSNAVSRNLPAGGNKDEEGNTAESLANGLNVQVYPNPTNNLLHIQAPEGSTLRLIDLNGRAITSRKANATEEQLDLSALAAGVYLLEVNSEGQLYHERIVKE